MSPKTTIQLACNSKDRQQREEAVCMAAQSMLLKLLLLLFLFAMFVVRFLFS